MKQKEINMLGKIKNIFYYLQGSIRYKLYYSTRFKWLLRRSTVEQIASRIISMDIECYTEGQCKMCGCNTTALQMCNKPCDKPCYPKMTSRSNWNKMKATQEFEESKFGIHSGDFIWTLNPNNTFEKHEIKEEHLGKSTVRLRREARKYKS